MDKQDYRGSDSHTNVGLTPSTHARLKDASREAESLAATIERGLDAIERENALPDEVTSRLPEGESGEDSSDRNSFRFPNETHARLKDEKRGGETFSGVVGRALDALEREGEIPVVVGEVLSGDE